MTWRSNLRAWVVISIVLMAFVSPSSAKVIYVDANAPGPTHDGSSWTNAYNYLQDALAAASSGDEIWVAEGVYDEQRTSVVHSEPYNTNTGSVVMKEGVHLYGGFAGWESIREQRDWMAHVTIIDGSTARDGEHAKHVVIGANNATIDGFTITGGEAIGVQIGSWGHCPRNFGGGMYNDESSPTVINCTFSGNLAFVIGGGMYNRESSPIVMNCTFTSNSVTQGSGGGMSNSYQCSPVVTNCTFVGNSVSWAGGGINSWMSFPTITNCIFMNNSAGYWGGGVYNVDSSSVMTKCTFIGNSAKWRGGGMRDRGCSSMVTNCTFIGNLATFGGGIENFEGGPIITNCMFTGNLASSGSVMFNWNKSHPTLTNCTFAGNSATNGSTLACDSQNQGYPSELQVTNCILWDGGNEIWNNDNSVITIRYSDVQGGWAGLGNINADPCFAKPGYWDPNGTTQDANDDFWVDGDYHLKSQAGRWDPNSESWVRDDVTSPCIDAGNPGCPEANEPAPNGNRRNMGAYGGTVEASKSPTYWRSLADMTNDWIVDSNDLKVFLNYWLQASECIPGDFDRSRSVDFNDFAIFGGQWQQKGPGPGITYEIDECIPIEPASSAVVEFEPTRFTVTVEGRYIYFEDTMPANCCADEIELLMTVEGDLITIYEIEHTPWPPCPCMCDYPITATLGPFEPGIYILEVYQDGYFIGTTTVTIGPGS